MNIKFDDALNEFEPKEPSELLIGYDEQGKLYSHSFLRDGNLIISGMVGSGKSLTIQQMLLSGMFNWSPNELKFVLCDPKRVEYIEYKNSPHKMQDDILYEVDEINKYLEDLEKLQKDRFKMLLDVGAKDIKEYNEYAKQNGLDILPVIIVVIDEIADLVLTDSTTVDNLLPLLMKGRAAGIRVLLSTQIPKANVLQGRIKMNIDSRIALKLPSSMYSQIALDEAGAEELELSGDMLYRNDGHITHLQSTYTSDENIKSVCDYVNDKYNVSKGI